MFWSYPRKFGKLLYTQPCQMIVQYLEDGLKYTNSEDGSPQMIGYSTALIGNNNNIKREMKTLKLHFF